MAISDELVQQVVKNDYISKVNDIVSKIYNLREICYSNAKKIRTTVRDFTETTTIDSLESQYRLNSRDYTLKFEKSFSDGSDFVSALITLFNNSTYVRRNTDYLSALNLDEWEEIDNIQTITSDFLSVINETLLKAVMERIYSDYTNDEFLIALNYSVIRHDTLSFGIVSLLTDLDYRLSTLSNTFNYDYSTQRTKVDGYLNDLSLNTDGTINHDTMSTLPIATQTIIKEIQYTTDIVLNNSVNDIAKITGYKDFKTFVYSF